MSFKVLAIRINSYFPLAKNLKEHVIYKFSKDIIFLDEKGNSLASVKRYQEINAIEDRASYPESLYAIKKKNGKTLDINIAAILGKNGSGKSSLLEMLYLMIFCLSERKGDLKHGDFISKKIKEEPTLDRWRQLADQTANVMETTDLELYYQTDDGIYVLSKSQKKQILQFKLIDGGWKKDTYVPRNFFYTICINYSQYSLNANGAYYWLKPLFHKNDGYKTPLVLNPFRSDGNIDITRELHLAQTRLLTNMSNENFKSETVIDKKVISSVTFLVRPAANGIISGIGIDSEQDIHISEMYPAEAEREHSVLVPFLMQLLLRFDRKFREIEELAGVFLTLNDMFKGAITNFGKKTISDNREGHMNGDELRVQLGIYIVTKVLKICNKYPEFRRFATAVFTDVEKFRFFIIKDAKELTRNLLADQTHITLKLKQAINVLLSGQLTDAEWVPFQDEEFPDFYAFKAELSFDKVKSLTTAAFGKADYNKKSLSHFIPVAFFAPSIEMSDAGKPFPFYQLSSGEQQLIHSVHSVLYHLLNLESIARPSISRKHKYQYVNLVLDEIELYYHPSYQRDFIKFLLENIEKVDIEHLEALNIIFSTHSPFILSDIPLSNVLKLQEGSPVNKENEEQTFGANIHDMLADSFFLNESLIGGYAEKMINKCIAFLEQMRIFRDREALLAKPEPTKADKLAIEKLKDDLLLVAVDKSFKTYATGREKESESQFFLGVINLIGEPVIRFKLLEMYDEVMLDADSEKEKVRRRILEMMKSNKIDKSEL